MTKRDFLIIVIIMILIINIFIVYNQAHQISYLNDDIIWLDQRVEFLESRVYNHTIKLDEFDEGYQTHLNEFDKLINVLIDGGFIYQTTCD